MVKNQPPAPGEEPRHALSRMPEPERGVGKERPGLVPACPRCHVLLKGERHALGIAWRCGICGGESLNFSQFRRMIPELHANEIWMTVMEQPVAPRRRAGCPECRRDMAAVLVPFEGRHIELDICHGCQRLWMERQDQRSYRLDYEDPGPGPQPPVIRMTGRGVARAVAERLRQQREVTPFTWFRRMYYVFLLGVLLMMILRFFTGR